MSTKAADDYSAIAARMRELALEASVPAELGTVGNYCHKCENGGWVQVYSQRPPAFDVCPDCLNPTGNESP